MSGAHYSVEAIAVNPSRAANFSAFAGFFWPLPYWADFGSGVLVETASSISVEPKTEPVFSAPRANSGGTISGPEPAGTGGV